MERQLWVPLPKLKKNRIFPFLQMDRHCGNCAKSVMNGGRGCGIRPEIIDNGNGKITLISSCSGLSSEYPRGIIRTYPKGTHRRKRGRKPKESATAF